MANPRLILKLAVKDSDGDKDASPKQEPFICELISKVFTTRNLLHFAHLTTKSFSTHLALEDMYEDIVDAVDEIAETYIGEFGELEEIDCPACDSNVDVIAHLSSEFAWIKNNRQNIAKKSTILENLLDSLAAKYSRTLYKLKNLH